MQKLMQQQLSSKVLIITCFIVKSHRRKLVAHGQEHDNTSEQETSKKKLSPLSIFSFLQHLPFALVD